MHRSKNKNDFADRIHLIAHAAPPDKDIRRFGFANAAAYLAFVRAHLPPPLCLTASKRLFEGAEDEQRGGRRDDAARIRDLQDALDDPRTRAIVAANGGAYFSRLLPHLDFSGLARRRAPLWALGFSEMTTLVNLVASYPAGRGLYWLCPNYLAWKIHPVEKAREAFAEFWRTLPDVFSSGEPRRFAGLRHSERGKEAGQENSEIHGRLIAGRIEAGTIRCIGGCLSVLSAALAGPVARRLKPDDRWLVLEDVNEAPYRIDRYLATLKIAGWFDRLAGVLVGDFHSREAADQQKAVVELLRFHLPTARRLPVVLTKSFGHVWPLTPLLLNRPLTLTSRGKDVTIR